MCWYLLEKTGMWYYLLFHNSSFDSDPDIIAIIQPEADGKDTMMTVDAELAPLATHRDQIPDIPIFANEEDRLDFEKNLDNIDLSAVSVSVLIMWHVTVSWTLFQYKDCLSAVLCFFWLQYDLWIK